MYREPVRHTTIIEDGEVSIRTANGRLYIGHIDTINELLGGPSWTISYTDRQKQQYPDLDTADEGITVDIVDMVNAMEVGDEFVDALDSLPEKLDDSSTISPRLGLFVGRLLEALEEGLD